MYFNKPVKRTSNISFDEVNKTFRLYTNKSIYAFCISPEKYLEHLHWGEKVPEGYDLRYLSQSSRFTHFNTVEVAPDPFNGKIVLQADTIDEIHKTWKDNKIWTPVKMDDHEYIHKKRLENYSWRIMSKISQDDIRDSDLKKRFPSLSKVPRSASMSTIFTKEDRRDDKYSPTIKLRRAKSDNFSIVDIDGGISLSPGEMSPLTYDTVSYNRSVDDHCNYMGDYDEQIPLDSSSTHGFPDQQQNMFTADEKFHQMSQKYKNKFLDKLNTCKKRIKRKSQAELFDRAIGAIGRGGVCMEYAEHGLGDYRSPSYIVVDNFTGSPYSSLTYKSHKIYRGKLPLPDSLPEVRCFHVDEASTLLITLADTGSGLEVDLIYVCMHDYDVITRRTVFRNIESSNTCSNVLLSVNEGNYMCGSSKVISKASSATVDFEVEPEDFYVTKLGGSWARERHVVEHKMAQGLHSFGSMKGVSSHDHNPFLAITFGHPNESHGEVRAFSLLYSGNFLIESELAETGRLRVNVGIHPRSIQWNLMEGQQFSTPEVVMVRSSEGLGGISRSLHRLFLERLIPRTWADSSPPVLLNTWESKHFHVSHDIIVLMARKARTIGVDLVVVDDGWFRDRNDANSGLGDWIIDFEKFPLGLKGLTDALNALGCKVGIYMSPEVASRGSLLVNAHPDWYMHVPEGPQHHSRNQVILDLTREDVQSYLFHTISNLLRSANIEYLKWDIGRPLTEAYSLDAKEKGIWQSEISHRYVLGLYKLQHRIVTEFPHLLLENCATGGGRFDPGMLYYSPQIWCSDNTDAIARMRIQYGTSYAYPARTVGAHISGVPNQITGNLTRLRTRAFVAMSGTFGFEMNFSEMTDKDLQSFLPYVDCYKKYAHVFRTGDMYRIWNPFKSNLAAWMFVTRDKSEAMVIACSINSDHWSNLVPRLPLQGLLHDTEYEVMEPIPNNVSQSVGNVMLIESEVPVYQLGTSSFVLTGAALMTAGLPVKFFTLDDSVMFHLKKVDTESDLLHVRGRYELGEFETKTSRQNYNKIASLVGGMVASSGNYRTHV